MVDVAVSSQLQQWAFDKPAALVRPARSDSSASSPDLYNNDSETLRIDAAVDNSTSPDSKETLSLQERYLSSEEDLSPMQSDSDDDDNDDDDIVSIHDFEKECLSARRMSIARFDKIKTGDMAVTVSYVSAGRPKMISVPHVVPIQSKTQRSASLAQLPTPTISKLRKADQASRLSLTAASSVSTRERSLSPVISSRRPSTGHEKSSQNSSSLRTPDASSFGESISRSSSPAISERSMRPVSARAATHPLPRQSMLQVVSNVSTENPLAPFPPLTPRSPAHSFLSSDPYENANPGAASPIIKSGPHKRLRSISQKLSLAKIAITPLSKKYDGRANGRPGNMPPTPATPFTPLTPQSAPIAPSPKSRLRRNSKLNPSRPSSSRGPSPDIPPVPMLQSLSGGSPQKHKLVARGANERAPTIEIPPCPDADEDPMASIKSRRLRKRKSLMDLML